MARSFSAMDCDRALEVLYLVNDRCFESPERDAFHDHVERCDPCRQRARFSARVILLVRERSAREPAPAQLRLRILRGFAHRQADDA